MLGFGDAPWIVFFCSALAVMPMIVANDKPVKKLSHAEYIRQLEREVGIEPWAGDEEINPWAWTAGPVNSFKDFDKARVNYGNYMENMCADLIKAEKTDAKVKIWAAVQLQRLDDIERKRPPHTGKPEYR